MKEMNKMQSLTLNNQHYDLMSSLTPGAFYVINTATGGFSYVAPNDLFLCGYPVEEALVMGINFHEKIMTSADFEQWEEIYKAVSSYLSECKEKSASIEYFSCILRLQRTYSFKKKPIPQMVTLRILPSWEDNTHHLICSIRSSTAKAAGNFRLHHKCRQTDIYCFRSKKWKCLAIKPLTEREQAILILSIQGKSAQEISDILHKSSKTIKTQINTLFQKLSVNSMREAIEFTSKHNMIYASLKKLTLNKQKRKRILFTSDLQQQIQGQIDTGIEVRAVAKMMKVNESTIRSWLKKGKLKR